MISLKFKQKTVTGKKSIQSHGRRKTRVLRQAKSWQMGKIRFFFLVFCVKSKYILMYSKTI